MSCKYFNLTTESSQPHSFQERKSRASINPGTGVLAVSSSALQPAPHQVLMSKAKVYCLTKATLADRGKPSRERGAAGNPYELYLLPANGTFRLLHRGRAFSPAGRSSPERPAACGRTSPNSPSAR